MVSTKKQQFIQLKFQLSFASTVFRYKCDKAVHQTGLLIISLSRKKIATSPYTRPSSNCLPPLFQNESSCKTCLTKMSLIWMKMNVEEKAFPCKRTISQQHSFSHWAKKTTTTTTRKWSIFSKRRLRTSQTGRSTCSQSSSKKYTRVLQTSDNRWLVTSHGVESLLFIVFINSL